MDRKLTMFVALLWLPSVHAAVYKCVNEAGEVAYQQAPCEGDVEAEPMHVRDAQPVPSGYNAACTHYDGRKVLSLMDMSKLSDEERAEYIDWLYDEGPLLEEKEACLKNKKR